MSSQGERWKESEADLFRLLVENVKDYAIFVLDPQGQVASWNPGAQRLLGYREDEIVGQSADIFFTPEDIRCGVPQLEMRAAVQGGRGNDDRWHVRKDGSRFWSGGMMTPLWDDDRNLRGFAKIMRDRTDWKLAEDERANRVKETDRRQRLYDAALSTTPDLVYVFDLKHRFIYANQGLLRMWGITWEEAAGKTCLQLGYEPWHAAMHAREIDEVAATKQPIKGEVPFTGTLGRRIYEYIFVPVIGENGEVEAVAGTTRDVTDRIESEEALRQSEQRFRSLMEQAPFSIQIFSPSGETIRVNRAWEELWGVRYDQMPGYNILQDRQLEARGILHLIQQGFAGQATQLPAIEYDPNETIPGIAEEADPRRWLSAVIYPLKDAGGQVQEVVLIHEDITARKRAEEELRRSEHQSRTILESITDAFFALDRRWNFTYLNRQAENLLARGRDELVGKNIWEEYPPATAKDLYEAYHKALSENITVRFETFYEPHNRWYEGDAYPSSEGLAVYFRDVSERKRTELALGESERRFRQLADAMPQIVWTAGPDGEIEYLNRRWQELTGLPATIGNAGWATVVHPADQSRANPQWDAALQSGESFETQLRLLDRRHGAYRWHLIRSVAIRDEQGNIVRWFGTSTDIHEQKRTEEASRYLAEASAALAAVVDYESTLQKVANLAVPYFSDWAAVDIADEGMLRRLAVAHQDPAKIQLVHRLMQEHPPDPRSPTGTYAVLRTGQPEFYAEITDDMLLESAQDPRHLQLIRSLGLRSYICVPLMVSGRPIGVLTFATAESGRTYTETDLALATDLAQRAGIAIENTQLYQELRETDRRKDEFLATLAHELRNPLAPIRNSLQILSMPRLDAEVAQRSREMMERQLHHLVRLVDDLLDVSRVMRGKIELRKERVELAAVIARAVETVQPLMDAQGHELHLNLSPDSLMIQADPVRLTQVVGNLLTNAAKYTLPGGRIWLVAERLDDTVVLRVRDTGIGISPEMLESIFELFVQLDHASTRAQGGLGIGLTLVQSLVQLHHGTVEAHSQGVGRGSEFIVRLPIAVPASEPLSGDAAGQSGAQQREASGFRLLVVDDNQDAANSLAMLLRLQGHEVRVSYNGADALDVAAGYLPDVIFLDIGMPKMDGYEVARRMRQISGLEKVVLAALTGWGQAEDRRRTAEAGFDHHLVKPPEQQALDEVLATLKNLMS